MYWKKKLEKQIEENKDILSKFESDQSENIIVNQFKLLLNNYKMFHPHLIDDNEEKRVDNDDKGDVDKDDKKIENNMIFDSEGKKYQENIESDNVPNQNLDEMIDNNIDFVKQNLLDVFDDQNI